MLEPIAATALTALISSVVGALVGALVSKIKTMRAADEQARQDADEMREMMRQNVLMTCRLTIYNDHFSVDEKLDAYKLYRAHGGNHQTKTYMDNLVGTDVDSYIERHG